MAGKYDRQTLTQRTDVIGWEVERDGCLALVREDGRVEADDEAFAEYLRGRLTEPVAVFRSGTLRRIESCAEDRLELRPGDGRYVVASVRSMAAEEGGLHILGIVWDR